MVSSSNTTIALTVIQNMLICAPEWQSPNDIHQNSLHNSKYFIDCFVIYERLNESQRRNHEFNFTHVQSKTCINVFLNISA